ncbi:MAG: hypothetical protein IID03_07130 [Candidatus Dadabacteria bacterium]|nr:hypothetical protein [Candidatus Dadabacteria bacterium]
MTEKWVSYLNGCIGYPYLETLDSVCKHDGMTGCTTCTLINSVRFVKVWCS